MTWDGKKLPDALAVAATAAANAAADGSKNNAYLTYIQGQIGSNFVMKLIRDDVPVWQGTASGSLTINGSRFVLPTTVTQNSITASVIGSGQWILRTENSTDPTKYIATGVTPTDGIGPFRLTADLEADGTITLGSLLLNSPSFDTVVSYPGVSDSRRFAWIDPAYTWASTPTMVGTGASTYPYMQINNVWTNPRPITEFPEPGVLAESRDPGNPAPAGEYTIARVTHPDNPAKMAILHRIDSRYLAYGTTERSQMSTYAVRDNTTYWIAFSFRPGSDMAVATPTAPGEGLNILDVHTSQPSGSIYGRQPIETFWSGGNRIRFDHYGQYTETDPPTAAARVISWTSDPLSVNVWYHLIYRFRVAKSFAGNPLFQAWFATGSGALTEVVPTRTDIMMGYYDMLDNACFPKMGPYRWVLDSRRTMHTVGMYIFRDGAGSPPVDQTTLHALLLDKQ